MYQTVHGSAACEAVHKPVPGPPQAHNAFSFRFFSVVRRLHAKSCTGAAHHVRTGVPPIRVVVIKAQIRYAKSSTVSAQFLGTASVGKELHHQSSFISLPEGEDRSVTLMFHRAFKPISRKILAEHLFEVEIIGFLELKLVLFCRHRLSPGAAIRRRCRLWRGICGCSTLFLRCGGWSCRGIPPVKKAAL